MVTYLLDPPPAPPPSGGGIGGLLLLTALGLGWWFIRLQLNPIGVCGKCNGKPPGDGRGNTHPCSRCGGNSRPLKAGAWVLMRMGVPVPRARSSRKHPFRVPEDDE